MPAAARQTLSQRELNRATLARQLLLERVDRPAAATIEHLGGMQAQTPHTWYVGLWSRLDPFDPHEVGRMLVDRELVRIGLQRSTIHLVTADDALWMRPLHDAVLRKPLSSFARHLRDLDQDAVAAAARPILEAEPLGWGQLGRRLAERWPDRDPASLAQVARARLALVKIPPRGIWRRSGQALHTARTGSHGQERRTAWDRGPPPLAPRPIALDTVKSVLPTKGRDRRRGAPRATRVDVIRHAGALESRTYWVRPPRDRDRAGIWRLGGTAGLLLGLAALNEARTDRTLSRRQRLVAGAFAGAYAAGGAYTLAQPAWLARAVIRWPRRTLATAFAPLAAEGPSGGAHTPLHTLTAACAGSSAVVYGQRTGARAARYASVMWSVQARTTGRRTRPDPPPAWVHIVLPLTYQIVARVTATLASLAYNARSLDTTLHDLAEERRELRGLAEQLDGALRDASPQLVELLGDATPAQRRRALRALGRLHEARAALHIALMQDQPDASARSSGRVRRAFRARGLGAVAHAVPTRAQTLASICETQRAALGEVVPPGVDVRVAVDPRLSIEGVDRIAVMAATVTAGIMNAVRHAERLRTIAISARQLADDRVELRIANDGAGGGAPPQPGSGLRMLEDELARVQGGLDTAAADDGWFQLLVTLPARVPQSESGQLLSWDRIEAKVDAVLGESVHLCAAMVLAQVVDGRGWDPGRRRAIADALLSLLPPTAAAIEEQRGRHSPWPLMAAVVVSAVARGRCRGILCGWCNAALARHALHHTRAQTEALVAFNAAALAGSYASAADRKPLGGQLATLVVGPLATIRIVLPAIDRLRSQESDVIATLSAIETVQRIVQDVHTTHSCIGPIEELAGDDGLAPARRAALASSATRIRRASTPEERMSERLLGGLVGEVCTVIGRRVWPASLAVEVDRPGLASVGSGIGRMRLRRTAIAVADAVARETISHRPARLDGSRGVKRVEVRVGGTGISSSVHFRVRPIVRRDADSERRLRARIDELGGAVLDWTGGELTFALYPAR